MFTIATIRSVRCPRGQCPLRSISTSKQCMRCFRSPSSGRSSKRAQVEHGRPASLADPWIRTASGTTMCCDNLFESTFAAASLHAYAELIRRRLLRLEFIPAQAHIRRRRNEPYARRLSSLPVGAASDVFLDPSKQKSGKGSRHAIDAYCLARATRVPEVPHSPLPNVKWRACSG